MKNTICTAILILIAQFSFANSIMCPDPPSNDDPCITSDNPPLDLTGIFSHVGNTCCARGPQDFNSDGSSADFENIDCNAATEGAAVWYMYTPDPVVDGYSIVLETGSSDASEGPVSIEIYAGPSDQGCNGGFLETIASSCVNFNVSLEFGNCFAADEVIFIRVSTNNADENCGDFVISITASACEFSADECLDLIGSTPLLPSTNEDFILDYYCETGCLDFACPETDNLGGCPEFNEMPTVWFQVSTDNLAAQLFSTVESNGNWTPIWSVFSGPDCNNLSLASFGDEPSCSNGDNTPDVHQTTILDGELNYWIMVTADPSSVPSTGIDDGSFEICVSTTINAIICLGEFEGGACDEESLIIEITERDNEDQPLDGPFCQGEEVTVNISFFYDASQSGADWLIGIVPIFGSGWDMSDFDYDNYPPFGNGQPAQWYGADTDLAPILQEPVPILCTYTDEEGILQLCNQLCSSCTECEQPFMEEGDPLPSGYFWVSNGGNAGCDNDGSPGEGWGIGSVTAQIDWTFNLRVKEFTSLDDCFDNNDLSISFQTFSDGVAGCWEDPVGECLLDRAMHGPNWSITCSELPPAVLADNIEICNNSIADVALNTEDGSDVTIIVKALENFYISGANDYEFIDGVGVITDLLINNDDVDRIMYYEVYAVDSTLACNGPKTVVEVLVRSQYINDFPEVICDCNGGCSTIGVENTEGYTYLWSTGEGESMIDVCPSAPTAYALTVTDPFGCSQTGSVLVDCQGITDECLEPVYYKLVTDYFVDLNENGIRDSFDLPFSKGGFFLEPDLVLYFNTDPDPDTIFLEEGDYTLIFAQGNLNDYDLTTDSIVTVTLDSAQNCQTVEFGLVPNNFNRNIYTSHYLNHRCNTDQTFYMYVQNNGTQLESGTAWAILDEDILPDDFPANATIDTFIAPNKIGWFFENLPPGSKITKTVDVHIPGPPDFPVGWVVNHNIYVEVDNSDGTSETWGEKDITRTILCGYDPNDKAVEPSHEEGYTDIEEDELVYKIRFQNTGNAPAENIEIRDTLSEFLNVLSVEYIAGSHDEFLTLSRVEDRVLVFKLDNINLPDSISDLEGSQGFLIYKVSINEDVEEGTRIENTAHIYFDYNPAIVTNTTRNILYPDMDGDGFFSVEDCNDDDISINPMAEEIPNNDVDEDCDGVALIIDNDMDGFNSDEDCDDENAEINPDAEEIINNDVDENCDDLVVIIDNDDDGFNSDDDCDDENSEIYPGAIDIPGNGIDEDCDGVDAILIGLEEELIHQISISPNPSNDEFNISLDFDGDVEYIIRDVIGREVDRGLISSGDKTVYLGSEPNGLYLIVFSHAKLKQISFHKLLKI